MSLAAIRELEALSSAESSIYSFVFAFIYGATIKNNVAFENFSAVRLIASQSASRLDGQQGSQPVLL